MRLVGTPVRRVEDHRLLTGGGEYVASLDLPGTLEVSYVVSTVAHARVTGVDVEAARRAPGVVDVVTADDIDPPSIAAHGDGNAGRMPRPVLAGDTVRFVGEPLVAIVAESAAACADAAELVQVDYEPLQPVVSASDARRDEVLLFPQAGTNVVSTQRGGSGDALPFAACEVVVEADFVNQRLAPCPLETRAAASVWDDAGRLHHWSSCQGAHPVRAVLADHYQLPENAVRVIAPDVGGSFGAKARPYPEELLLPLLAKRTGRPVRWIPSRSVDMVGIGHSRAQHQHVRIGGDRDGSIRCLEAQIIGDAGAYPGVVALINGNTGIMLPGPYRIPHVSWSVETVVTNTTPVVAYRGAGRPEASALIERAVDLFAGEIGLDPADVRHRNLIGPELFPYETPSGLTLDSGEYARAFDRLLDEAGYAGLREEQARRRAVGDAVSMGIGIGLFVDRTAGYPTPEFGAVELLAEGRLRVLTGSSPYGQGHHTAWAMLAAERTGIAVDRVEVVHGDTDVVPRGSVTGGSRSAQVAGSAVVMAADALVAEARGRAADLLEAAMEDVVLDVDQGHFHVVGAPGGGRIGWSEIAASAVQEPLRCEADFSSEQGSFPFGAYLAVVEVDSETGATRLRRMVTVDDAGTVLNPLLALGQVHGGVAQGIAQSLLEEFVFDDDGNPLSGSFVDYCIPSAAELPSFECTLVETPSPLNPLGFKGIAESGCLGAPPAVQNAVIDALGHLGVRHLDMPLTPERVWTTIRRGRASV